MDVATREAFYQAIPVVRMAVSAAVPAEAATDPGRLLRWFTDHPDEWAVLWTALNCSLNIGINDLIEGLRMLAIDESPSRPALLAQPLSEGSRTRVGPSTASNVDEMNLKPEHPASSTGSTPPTWVGRTRSTIRMQLNQGTAAKHDKPGREYKRLRSTEELEARQIVREGRKLRRRIAHNFGAMCDGKPTRGSAKVVKQNNKVLEIIIGLQREISFDARLAVAEKGYEFTKRCASGWVRWAKCGPVLHKLIRDVKLAKAAGHDNQRLKAILGWDSVAKLQIVDLT
ncbi:hypothetical protein K461DRAFT_89392 [Myriangium duriaei CBS 260.36]|uniref:Uncharacterized protein n=1 Tax=Myriangium duriaei CBS 260.36 TaxID=1168546 RepID=A0A9P4J651_9PEZI|nr:hypothetical protein K461DRAFT_89392 [Myriangium duriaei CBS 260.36]